MEANQYCKNDILTHNLILWLTRRVSYRHLDCPIRYKMCCHRQQDIIQYPEGHDPQDWRKLTGRFSTGLSSPIYVVYYLTRTSQGQRSGCLTLWPLKRSSLVNPFYNERDI